MAQTVVERKPGFEHAVLFVTFGLLALGLVVVYSATVYTATTGGMQEKTNGNGMYFLERQFLFVMAGLAALTVTTFIPFKFFRKLAWPGLILGLVAMVLVLFVGKEKYGAVRWYEMFGFSIQPGEFVKLAFILWMAHSLARKQEKVDRFLMGVLPHLVVALALVGLYVLQPDLGSTVILGVMMVLMLFVAGIPVRHIGLLFAAAVPLLSALIVFSEEKRARVAAWFHPELYAKSDAYQVINSKISIASGSLYGAGLGSGRQNITGYVPEAMSDFVYAILGEELGFIGACGVLIAFGILLWKGMRLAVSIRDHFARYVVFGVTLLIILQALINVGVATGLLPTKGLTLPFISMGGSSMVVMCTCVGILLNASRTYPRLIKSKINQVVEAHSVEVFVKEAR